MLLEEVTDFLFGGAVDHREVQDLVSKANDASEIHIPGNSKELKRKKRELNIGLANNAFGAAAGTVATKQAYNVARKMTPEKMAGTKTGRALLKMKIKPTVAVPVAGAIGVGAQLANGAMDAQSAQYFGRERYKLAQKKKKAVSKSFEDNIVWEGQFSKVDEDKRQVFGWCSITKVDGQPVVDRQGDYIPLDEVEKSAYDYVVKSRKGGDMHKREGELPLHASDMIESFVVTPDKLEQMGLEKDALPHGWWIGFKVNNDNLWEEVKKGDKLHFSIHGRGKRIEKSEGEL